MPLALERRLAQGSSRASLFWHVVWRAMALVLLSNVLSNWGGTGPLKLQFINVLCQIAFSYLLCFLLWNLRFPIQVAAGAGIMVLHHALFFLFPGPNGPFDQTGNVGAVIDMALLGYNYSGLYTTLNFLGNAITVLFGVWVGMLLQSKRTQGERIRILAVCAAGAFAFGLLLELWVPMVKRLWLASFTFYSAGWVLLAFLACYWMVECRNWRSWGQPAVIVGMNSIFIYSFSQVLRGWLSRGIARFDGNFAVFGPYGAIAHNILVLAAMFGLCHWLYQRRIFFKL
jgi:predicted acyltransferase